jgi:hypothetical protein
MIIAENSSNVPKLLRVDANNNLQVNLNRGSVAYTVKLNDIQSADASGTVTVWTPATGKKFRITDLIISVGAALSVTLLDGTTTIGIIYMAANTVWSHSFQAPLESTTANNAFKIDTSGAGNISVTVLGYEE